MHVKIEASGRGTGSPRSSRLASLKMSQEERDAAETAAEQVIVEMSPGDRLKGLTASEIKRALSERQTAGLRRGLLSDAERAPAYDQGYRAAMERVAAVAGGEHFEGREASAMELLCNDNLSPVEINSLLAKQPKASQSNADLIAALRNENQDLGDGECGDGWQAEAPGDLMKAAHAKAKERRGQHA